MAEGREPERLCVGCRRSAPKSELLRIVAGPDATAVMAPAGTVPGRGAYVHRTPACVDAAMETGALARALRVAIGAEEASNLLRELQGVIEGT